MATHGLWRNASFTKLWAAQSAAFVAFQTALFSIPLIAILLLDASPSQLGIVTAAFFAPSLVYGLLAGLFADRLDRRQMLLQGDGLTLLCGLAVPVAAAAGKLSMELLYIVSFLLGVGALHFDAAAASLLPTLVPHDALVVANGRLQLSLGLARVVGPAVGGLLIQLTSPLVSLASAAVGWVFCGLLLFRLGPLGHNDGHRARVNIAAEISDGIRFVLSNLSLRGTAAYTTLATGFAAMVLAVLPLYALQLGLTPTSLGFVAGAAGLGNIVGAVLTATRVHTMKRRTLGLGSAGIIALAQWLVPTASAIPHLAFPFLSLAQFLTGAALAVYTSTALSMQQESTPDDLRGRMFATVRFARFGSAAVGALVGGWVGQAVGLAPLTALAAVGATLSLWWLTPRAVWLGARGDKADSAPA
jgi:MFS family permease